MLKSKLLLLLIGINNHHSLVKGLSVGLTTATVVCIYVFNNPKITSKSKQDDKSTIEENDKSTIINPDNKKSDIEKLLNKDQIVKTIKELIEGNNIQKAYANF